MTVMEFEVRSERRVIVSVDVAKHVAAYPRERAEFQGTDEEFVTQSLNIIGVADLLHSGGEDIDDGITVTDDYDEDEIDLIHKYDAAASS